jgi:hypothetical protein
MQPTLMHQAIRYIAHAKSLSTQCRQLGSIKPNLLLPNLSSSNDSDATLNEKFHGVKREFDEIRSFVSVLCRITTILTLLEL